METFVVCILLMIIFVSGILTGNVTSTVDISQKEVIEANKLCENNEGLYKINKGSKSATAFCKDNDKFTLKGEK